jgi:hypothetical protein
MGVYRYAHSESRKAASAGSLISIRSSIIHAPFRFAPYYGMFTMNRF